MFFFLGTKKKDVLFMQAGGQGANRAQTPLSPPPPRSGEDSDASTPRSLPALADSPGSV